MLDLVPLISKLSITDKEGLATKFPITAEAGTRLYGGDFGWAQRALCREVERQYNAGQPVRIIVLKARQLGLSTVSAGINFLWLFIYKNINGLIVAHENDTSQSLFEKTQYFWDTCPWNGLFTTKHATQKRMSWKETGSSIRIASAKNLGAGRGRTIQALHSSECAQYINAEMLMVGLRQTLPRKHGTIEIIESTAQGIGNWYHHQWQLAEEGKSGYTPLFFPWFKHFEYKAPTSLCTKAELDVEERRLLDLGATYENIEWRRYALPNDCNNDEDYFKQEYPATPAEAFMTSGANIFSITKLEECYAPLNGHRGRLISPNDDGLNPKWIPDPHGPLTVFKRPTQKSSRSDRYFVAGDPSMTVVGDPACIQVLNRATMEQVAVWHGRINPMDFAREMMLLGRWYHDAELCPEVEGGGQQTIALILHAGYPNVWVHRWADKAPGKTATSYGFSTNYNRKQWAVGRLQYHVTDGSITIHDVETFHQMMNYVRTNQGGDYAAMGPADQAAGGHDDAVMALAIAVFGSTSEEPFNEWQHQQADIVDIFETQGK